MRAYMPLCNVQLVPPGCAVRHHGGLQRLCTFLPQALTFVMSTLPWVGMGNFPPATREGVPKRQCELA